MAFKQFKFDVYHEKTLKKENRAILKTILKHNSGEELSSSVLYPQTQGRNPLHDWGANCTYIRRFSLLAILGIAPGIEDNDGDHLTLTEESPVATVNVPKQKQEKPIASNEIPKTLTNQERKEVLATLSSLRESSLDKFNAFAFAFKANFHIPQDEQTFSDHIQELKHAQWIEMFLRSLGK